MQRRGMLVLIGLVLGCATGVAARSFVAPDAVAQSTSPVAFQYHCVNTHARWSDEEVEGFNRLGEQGWELITMTVDRDLDYQACFKRRIR